MKISELDQLIRPEIINDQLYKTLRLFALNSEVNNILEIGSSSGEGSTRALYEGICNRKTATLFCLEVSKVRFAKLVENYENVKQVKCFNMSSVSIFEFPKEEEVEKFYHDVPSMLNNFPLKRVLGWLNQDIRYIIEHRIWEYGINYIKGKYKIENFDMVLIDGSEFTGYKEFKKVYGSGILVLDDICSFKNYQTYHDLLKDPNYRLVGENKTLRSGFAVFEKKGK